MNEIKLISYYSFTPGENRLYKIAGWLIKWWTRSKYYHTEILINNTLVTALIKEGVVVIDIDKKHYMNYISNIADVQTISVTQLVAKNMLEFSKTQEGLPYDWRGIIYSQFIPLGIENKRERFCSEIGTALLKMTYLVKVLPLNPSEYNPGSLYKAVQDYLNTIFSESNKP